MSEYSNKRRDKAIANEADAGDRGHTRDQMCAADGCPNRWAVKREGRAGLCSAHDAVADSPRDWPRIAEQQRSDEVERAQLRGAQHHEPEVALSNSDRQWPRANPAIVARVMAGIKLREVRDPRQWARDLMRAEEEGERLTSAQRTMWRAAGVEVQADAQP
jgi:hypothetical protein